ncbi:DUF4436 family protein [Streptomyces paradoxus]|uniref:DUF4436 family protein n=1 Tax=Streptomyces paradoxus TaxID=66375 RepID=UPI00362913E4
MPLAQRTAARDAALVSAHLRRVRNGLLGVVFVRHRRLSSGEGAGRPGARSPLVRNSFSSGSHIVHFESPQCLLSSRDPPATGASRAAVGWRTVPETGCARFVGLARSGSLLVFAVFMMVVMWALAASVLIGAWYLTTGSEGLVWPGLAWMAATLFALAAFRNTAPGTPPIGCVPDWFAFLWAESIIARCLGSRPSAPSLPPQHRRRRREGPRCPGPRAAPAGVGRPPGPCRPDPP